MAAGFDRARAAHDPGLALFYGGLNRAKGVLNMMMMSFSAIGLISAVVVLRLQRRLRDRRNGFWGDPGAYLGTKTFLAETDLWGATAENPSGIGVPLYVFMAFQMIFAVITVALISGAIADRAKFAGWLLFAFGWATLVYFPVAHWVWGGGIIGADIHALDFAGGTAVHINAGAAALAVALVLGKRLGWPREGMKPHNMPLVALGAGLLWFGWFGFNAGSELTVDSVAGLAFINTQVATAAAVLGWIAVEWIKDGKPTMVGASSGAVAGLVAITPACGFIAPLGGRRCSASSPALVCALAVSLKYKLGYDDSLDVVGVHFVGGWIGSLWLGLLATNSVNAAISDVVGAPTASSTAAASTQLGRQALAGLIVHGLLLRGRLRARLRHREDHRLPGQGRGRGRGHRHRRARRERLRPVPGPGRQRWRVRDGRASDPRRRHATPPLRRSRDRPGQRKGRRLTFE